MDLQNKPKHLLFYNGLEENKSHPMGSPFWLESIPCGKLLATCIDLLQMYFVFNSVYRAENVFYVCRHQQLWGAVVCTSIPSQKGSERALEASRNVWHHQAAYQCSDLCLCSLKYWIPCWQLSVLSTTVGQGSQWLIPSEVCPSPADKVRHCLSPHPEGSLAGCLGQDPCPRDHPFNALLSSMLVAWVAPFLSAAFSEPTLSHRASWDRFQCWICLRHQTGVHVLSTGLWFSPGNTKSLLYSFCWFSLTDLNAFDI